MESNITTAAPPEEEEAGRSVPPEPASPARVASASGAAELDTSSFPAHYSAAQDVVRQPPVVDSENPSLPQASAFAASEPAPSDQPSHHNIASRQDFEPAAMMELAATDSASVDSSIHSSHSAVAAAMDSPSQVNRKKKRKRPNDDPTKTSGRWTKSEHEAFLKGLATYGREWKRVAQHIATRTSAQVRSHAQKYLRKQEQMLLAQNPQHQTGGGGEGDWYAYLNRNDEDTESNHTHDVSLDHHHYHDNGDHHYHDPPSASLQLHVDRILAQPHAVAQQVNDTLAALHQRYHDLQQQLRGMSVSSASSSNGYGAAAVAAEPVGSAGTFRPAPGASADVVAGQLLPESTISSEQLRERRLPNECEWIALQVLHRKLSSPIDTSQQQQAQTDPEPNLLDALQRPSISDSHHPNNGSQIQQQPAETDAHNTSSPERETGMDQNDADE